MISPNPIGPIVKLPQYLRWDIAASRVGLGAFTPEFADKLAKALGENFDAYWHTEDRCWYALHDRNENVKVHLSTLWRDLYHLSNLRQSPIDPPETQK